MEIRENRYHITYDSTVGFLSGKTPNQEKVVVEHKKSDRTGYVLYWKGHRYERLGQEEIVKTFGIPPRLKQSGSQKGYPSEPAIRAVWRYFVDRYNKGDSEVEYSTTLIGLEKLISLYDEEVDKTMFPDNVEISDGLDDRLSNLFKELLDQERRSVTGASKQRQDELRHAISSREAQLEDDTQLDRRFTDYLETLPEEQRPKGKIQKWRMFGDWEGSLRSELASWKDELTELEDRPVDKQEIFDSTRNKVMHLLHREARAIDLLPDGHLEETPSPAPPKPPSNGDRDKGKRREGRRGFEQIKDYLIPVIQLMKKGRSHMEAFQLVAKKLNVVRNTVQAQCTTRLKLYTQEFVDHVESGQIIQIMKVKYPKQIELINDLEKDLYTRRIIGD